MSRDRDRDEGRSRGSSRDEGRSRGSSRDEGGGRDRGGRDQGSERSGRERSSRDEGSSRSSRGGSSYQYHQRDASAAKKRADAGGGDFDKYLSDSVKMFKPNDGDNTIRILPPTWTGAEHFGYDIFVHYGVGPDSQTYLCLDKMKGEPCPICDERKTANDDGDTEYADKLKPTKRVLLYLVDRDNEKEGLQAWAAPWSLDRDLNKITIDKRTGDLLPIDDPVGGYDVMFDRTGKGDRTKYGGLSIARRDSQLGNDRWMDEAVDNPLPTLAKFYDYDHIAKVFGGKSAKRGDGASRTNLDREQEAGLREAERGGRGSSRGREETDLTWDSIHSMSFEELGALIDQERLDIKPDDSKDDIELADWICEDLKIAKEEPQRSSRRQVSDDTDATGKLADMRGKRRQVD